MNLWKFFNVRKNFLVYHSNNRTIIKKYPLQVDIDWTFKSRKATFDGVIDWDSFLLVNPNGLTKLKQVSLIPLKKKYSYIWSCLTTTNAFFFLGLQESLCLIKIFFSPHIFESCYISPKLLPTLYFKSPNVFWLINWIESMEYSTKLHKI